MHCTKSRRWIALPGIVAIALCPVAAGGADPVQIISEQLAAIRPDLETVDRGSDGEREALEGEFERALAALDSGRWLESLRPYSALTEGLSQATARLGESPVESHADLVTARERLDAELQTMGASLGQGSRPAALQALLENAYDAAWAYAHSATEQGRESSLRAGIYYLKVARGRADFARVLLTLEGAMPESTVAQAPGLAAYLERLEVELLELYQPPLTQERHATFIQLSAGLKFAREMREKGHQLGALEQALDVAFGLARFPNTPTEPPLDRAGLRDTWESWRKRVEGTGGDQSLPQLWLADARSLLESEGGDIASASALLQRVLPDYYECIGVEEQTAAEDPIEPSVSVTLVRWPFT